MFYAHYVLSKRGPLARIWLAAHWDKKLTKAHVFETNLEDSVETIISPQVKMALRTSGHLLLGVVRIYNRKAKYLLADCSEAFVKIKMAFRSGVVDLPEENMEAQHNQIYIVEEFPNFDTPLPDISDFDVNRHLTLNQSRIDEITMPDEAPTTMTMDEGFSGVMVDGDENYGAGVFYKENDQKADKEGGLGGFMEGGDGGMKDGFGDGGTGGILDTSFLKGGGGLFGEPQEENFLGISTSAQKENDDMVAAIEQSEGVMDGSIMSPPPQPHQDDQNQVMMENQDKNDEERMVIDEQQHMNNDNKIRSPQHQQMMEQQPEEQQQNSEEAAAGNNKENNEENNNNNAAVVEEPVMKQPETTFALEPLNFTDVRDVRHRRKRKLIIDHLIELDGQTMREQLKDVEDIVTTLDMAPPTKRLMLWKEMGGVDKLFALPCSTTGDKLNKIFISNLHNTVPQDLVDVTGTQLQELFGENEPQPPPPPPPQSTSSAAPEAAHDMTESSIYGERKEGDASSIQMAPASDVSALQGAAPGANDTNATGASNAGGGVISFDEPASLIGSGNDLCMNTINRVNESDDDYDAMSNGGPPSVGDSVGAPPSPMGPMDLLLDMDLGHGGQSSMNDSTATLTSSAAAAATDGNRVQVEPERLPEPEGEAFPDDLDDLRWNKRTQHLINDLDRKFRTESEVSFFRLSDGITRKQAVSKFYSLLVLAKQEATQLSQSEVFGDVYIKKGDNFESVLMK